MLVVESDVDSWVSIFEYSENSMANSILQDMVTFFGEEAESRLEALIDSYGMESAFRIESWWYENNFFEFIIFTPDEYYKKLVFCFLKSCRVLSVVEGEDFDW